MAGLGSKLQLVLGLFHVFLFRLYSQTSWGHVFLMVMAETQEGNPKSGSTFGVFAHMSTGVPLARANHMTVGNIGTVEKYAQVFSERSCSITCQSWRMQGGWWIGNNNASYHRYITVSVDIIDAEVWASILILIFTLSFPICLSTFF